MKFNIVLLLAFLSTALVGCGGEDTSSLQHTGQRILSGGAQADAPAATVVNIAGYRDNYSIVKNETSKIVTVTSNIDKSVLTYQNPSSIRFVDKWTSFDIDGAAGQVYRLYQAAFNRQPDLAGLGFWIKVNENGRTATDIARDFVVSAEFKTLYGDSPANIKLINAFYNNVLHRDGEKAGVDWWVAQLDNGAAPYLALYGFSDSAENKANLLAAMQNGFDYVPYQPAGPRMTLSTSYANSKMAGLGSQSIPVEAGGMPQDGFAYFHAYGFADFFRDGGMSLVTSSVEYLNDPKATVDTATPGHIKFWKKDENGAWINNTRAILADDTGCLLARKVVIADFNGDGKPDVFFACSGYDGEPFRGERSRVLMSQANGIYTNQQLSIACFCHGGAAADFDGNGYADILVGDFLEGRGAYFLKNNKDGTFTVDTTRLPADAVRMKGAIFSAELVDMNGDGKPDVWLAGNEKDWPTSIFLNDGKNSFAVSKQIVMPAVAQYGSPTDIAVSGNYAYVLRTTNNYDGTAIQKIDLATMQSSLIYQNNDYYPGQPLKWVDWITIDGDSVVSINAVFGIRVKK